MRSVGWRRKERRKPSFGPDDVARDQRSSLVAQQHPEKGMLALRRKFRLRPR